MVQAEQLIQKQLEEVSRIPLFQRATPVQRLKRLYPSQEVWLKDDSRIHPICGGSKVRRLEFLLAPFRKNRREVLTVGYEASNHVLATSYFCAQLGIPSHFLVLRGPDGMSDEDQNRTTQKIKKVRALATSVEVVQSKSAIFLKGVFKLSRAAGQIQMIPAGGSSPVGVLGSFKAVFELASQVRQGDLPKPKFIYVPLGTGGTAVGLSMGLRVLQWDTKVIAVKIASERVNQLSRLRNLALRAAKLLPSLSADMADLSNLRVDTRFLGASYGRPLVGSQVCHRKWQSLEGVVLESIYSGKAALGLEAHLNTHEGPHLFWLTHGEIL